MPDKAVKVRNFSPPSFSSKSACERARRAAVDWRTASTPLRSALDMPFLGPQFMRGSRMHQTILHD